MSSIKREIKTIVVMRFSALGDVAMTVPVLKRVLDENPGLDIIMVSDSRMEGVFSGIERLKFAGFDLKGKFKGIRGIYRIYDHLNTGYEFQAVADLHGVLRTFIVSFLLWVAGKKVSFIDKGRSEKNALTRIDDKIFKQLKHTTDRYAEVFRRLGRQVSTSPYHTLGKGQYSIWFEKAWNIEQQSIHIGFAPFAKHVTKMYNLDRFKEVVKYFNREPYRLHLFGGSRAEQLVIRQWEKEFNYIVPGSVTGFQEELELMSKLKVMVSMDSANMHLASLVDVPVVSIWGPTHPYAGFYGYNQDPANAIQVDLSCRPCSVFGNKNCWRGDHACMQEIGVDKVIKQVKKIIGE